MTSTSEPAPKIDEVKAVITLRSGKQIENPMPKAVEKTKKEPEKEPEVDDNKEDKLKRNILPPFSQALKSKKKANGPAEILEALRQVKVNIPLLDMIKQVPTYAKFLKNLCIMKRGMNVDKKAFPTEQVSAIIQCKTLVKYKDPGCPTISMNIGGTCVEKDLLDLRASVNLLPYSVYKQLGLGELKPTTITLSLADRSIKIPKGIVEDVLVQVDKFYYPVDFVVLDTEPVAVGANYVPIILGRPFLATCNAIINCQNGGNVAYFRNMTLELNIFHLSKKHMQSVEEDTEEVCLIDTMLEDQTEQQWLQEALTEDLVTLSEELPETPEIFVVQGPWRRKEEVLSLLTEEDRKQEDISDSHMPELKPLPVELKYASLEENYQCPVVISSLLNASQESSQLHILRENKQAIGWKFSDLKGIDPLVCTHHIYLEGEARPVGQPQRRLNPHMQEVVHVEVLKLL